LESSITSHPEFANPPLIEVVFGVQFKELAALKALHLGALWEKIGKAEYPEIEEKVPIAHLIEDYGESQAKSPAMAIQSFDTPPLPRYFFVSEDQRRLVQLQRDRFLQNWRKRGENTGYPRFENLCPQFIESWGQFCGFVRDQNLGELQPDQYELTYVNHIEQGDGWTNEQDIEDVFPWFKCSFNDQSSAALEGVSWRRIYRLPDKAGRLHVSMQQVIIRDTKTPALLLNLTARGFAECSVKDWFDMAHEWIVRAFVDLTGPSVKDTIWKMEG